ncbi:MAG: NAD(P)H-binding protein [Myxococcota bacterium]|nr:NAD(P)H-binding protein [Myxococcota bacterium]
MSVTPTPRSSADPRPVVAVAGASGFIGSALAPVLRERLRLVGLTRSDRSSIPNYDEVRQADLFSRLDSRAALENVDFAIYLVHSMMPSARLVQANFRDLDLLCADNFAQGAAAQGVRHIVYVGGLQPHTQTNSMHLQSRLEVEQILSSYGVPVTTLRAGMIVGGSGSSFQILRRLIDRLPVMVCPSWTNTATHPVALRDVVWALNQTVDQPDGPSRVFDLGADERMSYRQLMATTAEVMGKSRVFFSVPLVTPGLSRLWVSTVTGAPKALVAPLISSLRHEMLAREDPEFRLKGEPRTPIRETLRVAIEESAGSSSEPRAFRGASNERAHPIVLSVQRMRIPEGRDAEWAAEMYIRWLPKAMGRLTPLRVVQAGDKTEFKLFAWGPTLLRIERMRTANRPVFRVLDGLLARQSRRGRLEFRTVLDGRTLIVAVHEFVPRLPWWIYRVSQALAHAWVMARFRKLLARAPAAAKRGT